MRRWWLPQGKWLLVVEPAWNLGLSDFEACALPPLPPVESSYFRFSILEWRQESIFQKALFISILGLAPTSPLHF